MDDNLIEILTDMLKKKDIMFALEELSMIRHYNKFRDTLMIWLKDYFGDVFSIDDIDKKLSMMDERDADKIMEKAQRDIMKRMYSNVESILNAIKEKGKDVAVEDVVFAMVYLKYQIAKSIKTKEDISTKTLGEILSEKKDDGVGGMYA